MAFFCLVFDTFPELWLWKFVREHHHHFIEEPTWDVIHMTIVMSIALLMNIAFIFFTFVSARKLRSRSYLKSSKE